jgi:tetratricopeptide (TPR) repeat protein
MTQRISPKSCEMGGILTIIMGLIFRESHIYEKILTMAQFGFCKFRTSVFSLRKVLELQPGFQDTWFRLGLTYGDQGEYKKAIEAFNEAIKQSPGAAYIYYNRAVAKAKSDPNSDYCADLKIAADMGYPDAIKMLKKVCR